MHMLSAIPLFFISFLLSLPFSYSISPISLLTRRDISPKMGGRIQYFILNHFMRYGEKTCSFELSQD